MPQSSSLYGAVKILTLFYNFDLETYGTILFFLCNTRVITAGHMSIGLVVYMCDVHVLCHTYTEDVNVTHNS